MKSTTLVFGALGIVLLAVACTEAVDPSPTGGDAGVGSADGGDDGGGAFSCSVTTRCAADDPADAECNAALAGSCSAEYETFGRCVLANQVCGADQRTDAVALDAACGDARQKFVICSGASGS